MASKTMSWEQLGEAPVHERLESGLEIFVLPKSGLKKTYATYATHYGSIDSHFYDPRTGEIVNVPDGIAHFLEHKMYEKPEVQVFERFGELGAYTNAYTEYTTTTFLFSATSEVPACLETLLWLVEEPYFTSDNVEKEKGIIEQEIRMYLDMPGERLRSNLMRALYHNNPVRLDIAGSVESIRTITPNDLYVCYNTFYHPSNMVIFIAGDVQPGRVIELIRSRQKRRELGACGPIQRIFPDEPDHVVQPFVKRVMPVSTPLFMMGYKDLTTGLHGADLLRRDVTMGILWSLLLGPSAPLFSELYDMGLINERFSANYTSATSYALSAIGGETPDPGRLEEMLVQKLPQAPLRHEDLERVKKKQIGEFVGLFEDLEELAFLFNSLYFRGIGLDELLDTIVDVSLSEVEEARATHLVDSRRACSVVLPIDHPGWGGGTTA